MSKSDSLLVEDRCSQNGLVIERSQDFAFHALGAIRSGEISWASCLASANRVLGQRDIHYILSGVNVPGASGRESRLMVKEIIGIAFKHRIPLCFLVHSDNQGLIDDDGDHLTFRAASLQDLTEMVLKKEFMRMEPRSLFREMKSSCTFIQPGNVKDAGAWLKAAEIVQSLCMKPLLISRPPPPMNKGPKTPLKH